VRARSYILIIKKIEELSMKKSSLLAFPVLMLLTSCLLLPSGAMLTTGVTVSSDEFYNSTTVRVNIYTPSFTAGDRSLGFLKDPNNNNDQVLMYSYIATFDWVFVEEIDIKVDGHIHSFQSYDSDREVTSGGNITEKNYYRVNSSLVKKLAAAKTVEYRLRGKYLTDPVTLNASHLDVIREFIQKANL
jgi:hypothetical protein